MQGSRGQVHKIALHGEKGTLELESDWGGYAVRGIRDEEAAFVDLPVPDDILQGVDPRSSIWDQIYKVFGEQSVGARLFIDSILAGKPITPSFLEGMKAQAVIEAALESDRTGCWVGVER
jgi:predicted dehydrogenase